ncbi:MAG: PorV/PorQ family protein [candidate division KSB1 bacterium]|nr:PorV/PorQ family protein [candidate division KSB1 bacterium]MDZ7273334.1 PorV/PorQ family protein [candidate division KSB1 bacterium]MDZ7287996.1 PorV/PorQ family protein [candidate division KSB1 bacterium]MDZ7300152.1 PorV/PorQ family protein [candidate division KSB1 bacterium]MDZ7308917.1 PorV/PorQ family protein [candidate division KSB1 bacterium]
MKSQTWLLMLVLLPAPALAQFDNAGTSAANFLKIGVGSRAEAMAGAYVAQASDISTVFWNVAGLADVRQRELMIARTDWILDVNLVAVAVSLPLGENATLAASVNALSMGDFEETTPEAPDGTGIHLGGSNLAAGLAYAKRLTDRFSVGLQGKYVGESVANSKAHGFALDFGTLYQTNFRGLKIGMSISHFGTKLQLSGREQLIRVDVAPGLGANPDETPARLETEAWPMPLVFRLGVSLDVFRFEHQALVANVDYFDYRDVAPGFCVGGEYSLNRFVFVRGGFRALTHADNIDDPDNQTFLPTLGGGLDLHHAKSSYRLRLDYAYSDLGRLSQAHRFTFAFVF